MSDNRLPGTMARFLFVAVIALLPVMTASNYVISVMLMIALYGVLSMGMGLLLGQAGMFSLAHPTWFGLGAYIAGILAARGIMDPLWGALAAAAGVALIASIIGAPVLRLKGFYLACATFAIIVIAQIAAGNLGSLTGGHEGLLGVPQLSIAGFTFNTDTRFYYLSWGLCLLVYWFLSNVMHSRVGRAIRSFHDSELASASLGVNIARYKLIVFILTAVMASLAGSIFCFYLLFAVPDSFGFPLLVQLMMMVIIGGLGSIRGALLGSFVVIWLTELMHATLGNLFPKMTRDVDAIFFGILIIVVLIAMPRGLIAGVDWLTRFIWRSHERA